MTRIYSCDFETTTQIDDCRVWAAGITEIKDGYPFTYYINIDTFMGHFLGTNSKIYFHNLKFDIDFILTWLFTHGFTHTKEKSPKNNNEFCTLISSLGQTYSLKIRADDENFTVLDSYKILPFPVKEIATGFALPILKGEIDYKKFRPVGYEPDNEEVEYLKNDCEIVARALHIMFKNGLTKTTQGSNALFDFKKRLTKKKFDRLFPIPDYDADIRQSYKGGFAYVSPRFAGIDIARGIVLDVNSLYPSIMKFNPMPYGEGIFFKGKYQPDRIYTLYVQMFRCNFKLKTNHIPMIQAKFLGFKNARQYVDSSEGEDITLCLTCLDLKMFLDHYDVYNLEFMSGWKFKSATGIFDEYIDYWYNEKTIAHLNGNKSQKTLAKLMLNALYGKFALNPHVRSKYPYLKNGAISFTIGEQEMRDPIYIPLGTFITSGARCKTISSAQAVYDRFMYADTDSLHLEGTEHPSCLDISETKIGAWKIEKIFDRARFIRPKTYIEEVNGRLDITCAGLPKSCYNQVTWDNFKIGTSYTGKLMPKHVAGGIVLVDTNFTLM